MTDIIQKVVDTSLIGDGNTPGQGGLTYAQGERFLDYMWDATVLGSLVTKRRMRAKIEEIDIVSVGARLVRGATEAVDTGENATPAFKKLSLTTKKYRLDWELSTESLEDGIEGENFDDHLARLMATQLGNDLEDCAINGDSASSIPGIKVQDGWRKRAVSGDEGEFAHVINHNGPLNREAFNKALKAMPRKYMARRAGLKFFTGSNAIQDYIFSLQQVENGFISPESLAAQGLNQAVRTQGPAGFQTGNAFGVPVQEVPLFDEARAHAGSGTGTAANTDLWLTFPDNLIWGVARDITIHREFVAKKDTIEYTVFVRQGTKIENADAFVVVRNVQVSQLG